MMQQRVQRSSSVNAICAFCLFGACMSGLTAFLLLFPGTSLDRIWRLNPHAREGFAALGIWAVVLMLAVCAACLTAATGLWRRRIWGLRTAIVMLSINMLSDAINAFVLHDPRTLIGLPIGGAVIWYLLRKRSEFS
jgi:hypothetical protein